MTFEAYETSAQSGAPYELYDFSIGLRHIRCTSGDRTIVYSGEIYPPEPIERTDIEETDDLPRADIDIACPRDFAIAEEFRVAPPSYVIKLSVYRIHAGDPDGERKLIWTGRVLNATWDGVQATIHCESILTSLRRPGLRRLYQRGCPHVLYGSQCGVSETAHKVVTTVATVAGANVTVNAGDVSSVGGDNYFDGGFVELETAPGTLVRRAIKLQIGDLLTLTHPIPGLLSPMAIAVYPGCDHSLATCDSKYANVVNYGGMPFISAKNPFGSNGL